MVIVKLQDGDDWLEEYLYRWEIMFTTFSNFEIWMNLYKTDRHSSCDILIFSTHPFSAPFQFYRCWVFYAIIRRNMRIGSFCINCTPEEGYGMDWKKGCNNRRITTKPCSMLTLWNCLWQITYVKKSLSQIKLNSQVSII